MGKRDAGGVHAERSSQLLDLQSALVAHGQLVDVEVQLWTLKRDAVNVNLYAS